MDTVSKRARLQQRLEQYVEEMLETARRKNEDYAQGEDPFQNFRLSEYMGFCDTARGILVRISDKMQRICNLLDKEASVVDERIVDTCLDAANYFLLLRAYLETQAEEGNTRAIGGQ